VAASNPRHLIIRVSWLYASQGHNFLRTMLRLGRERDKLAVVNDQWGRPTCAADLAETALFMAFRAMSSDGLWGLYHFTNSGAPTTWHHFACEIFSLSRSRAGHHPSVEPIDAEQFHTAAARPKNSVLSLDKIDCVFGIKPRGWQTALADTLNEFHKSNIEMEAS
jgi:dTDP-4-dehydrorhamnose reductase